MTHATEITTTQALQSVNVINPTDITKHVTGIYFIIRDNQVQYVGQSRCIHTRIRAHQPFDRVSFIPCKHISLDVLESLYLRLYCKTTTNKSLNYNDERFLKEFNESRDYHVISIRAEIIKRNISLIANQWLKAKQEQNEQKEPVKAPAKVSVKSYSKADPNDTVTSIPSMSFKRNKYQDDIMTAAAKKMKISKQQFLRIAALEYAAQMNIF